MMQFSVYIRNCASNENALVHIKRIKNIIPAEGIVSILKITDRQFGETVTFVGKKSTPPPPPATQLELFLNTFLRFKLLILKNKLDQ